jgi:hypothetical protein
MRHHCQASKHQARHGRRRTKSAKGAKALDYSSHRCSHRSERAGDDSAIDAVAATTEWIAITSTKDRKPEKDGLIDLGENLIVLA